MTFESLLETFAVWPRRFRPESETQPTARPSSELILRVSRIKKMFPTKVKITTKHSKSRMLSLSVAFRSNRVTFPAKGICISQVELEFDFIMSILCYSRGSRMSVINAFCRRVPFSAIAVDNINLH